MRMASLWPLDLEQLEVIASLLHLSLSLITFMVVQFITFMVSGFITFAIKSHYIYGQCLLHLWLVLHLWVLLHLWVIQQFH